MLTICPTVDYEIYLGRNLLPIDEVLFEPTRKLLGVWAEYGVHATFFPDVCSVWRHRELGVDDYADTFETQIKQVCGSGHDVQLHLHPEWLTAERRKGDWIFKSGTYSLHDLGFSSNDPHNATSLIRRGKTYLEEQLAPGNPKYRCIAFRAGGWIIQPEGPVAKALLAEDVRCDATVIPGMTLARTDYVVDFRHVPDKPTWFIDPSKGLAHDSGRTGDLLEISIASYRGRFPAWQHIINQLRLKRRAASSRELARGYPITRSKVKSGLASRIVGKYHKIQVPRVLDIADTHESMLTTVNSYLRHYDCRSNDFAVCMNGHSKDTYGYHLEELRRFFDLVGRKHSDVVRFETIAEYTGRVLPGAIVSVVD
ncbi:MAG: hypothetical protein OEN01_08405 [Candidatus Krumholzibacteria bacterium]|nr:hypothetical protein [Candidatus Krumholzibacteria bacterium]